MTSPLPCRDAGTQPWRGAPVEKSRISLPVPANHRAERGDERRRDWHVWGKSSWMPMIYRINAFGQDWGELEFTLALTDKSNYWTVTVTRDGQPEARSYSPASAATELLARTRTEQRLPNIFTSSRADS